MELSKKELELIKNALQYGVLYSQDEAETAELGLLYVKFEKQITIANLSEDRIALQRKRGCVFNYCSQNPECGEKCIHNS